jgi:hypothetical protein
MLVMSCICVVLSQIPIYYYSGDARSDWLITSKASQGLIDYNTGLCSRERPSEYQADDHLLLYHYNVSLRKHTPENILKHGNNVFPARENVISGYISSVNIDIYPAHILFWAGKNVFFTLASTIKYAPQTRTYKSSVRLSCLPVMFNILKCNAAFKIANQTQH